MDDESPNRPLTRSDGEAPSACRVVEGSQVGSYRIEARVGEGGMGMVYRAHDTKLNRSVAIKFLSEGLADAEARRRFQREARMASALNHPHILTVHDAGEFEGRQYLVTEFVDGGTLSDWARAATRSWRQVIELLVGVADGLAAAHEAGILHRDIKPANILVTRNGYAKLADFGLAKLAAGTAEDEPTHLTEWRTGALVILGTVGYMSPEQASGKTADARSDVFSLGVVLYEMLAGRKAFTGPTRFEVLQATIHQTPEPLPTSLPLELRLVVEKALEKDPVERYQSTRDLVVDLRRVIRQTATTREEASQQHSTSRRSKLLSWVTVTVAIVLLIGSGALLREWWRGTSAASPAEIRVDITTPPTSEPTSLAISPVGNLVVFVALSDGRPRLWLRSMDSVTVRPLAGTDGAQLPFWSPDSQSVGFFAEGRLKRIDVGDGSVQSLASAISGRGGTWNSDGVILFSASAFSPISSVSAGGEGLADVTRLNTRQNGHRFPLFLPDGHHFLYYATGGPEESGVYIGGIDGQESQRLFAADSAAVYAPSGHLLFVRQGTLFAQRFDERRRELSGDPFRVADSVMMDNLNGPALSASAAGPIAYRMGSGMPASQLVWSDRLGKELGRIADARTESLTSNPDLSPDGRRVAVSRSIDGNGDVWLIELERGVFSRFTTDLASEQLPVWSPDGSRIAFTQIEAASTDLYMKEVSAGTSEEVILKTPQPESPTDWSPDGRTLLYRVQYPKTGFDLFAVPMEGERNPFPVVQTEFDERDGQFSPDGRWIAYQSSESGRSEIYVQPFPGPGPRAQISANGGAQPRWNGDGKEVFYIGPDERLMSVEVRFDPRKKTVQAAAPVPLFTVRVGEVVPQSGRRQQYVVSSDGRSFLINMVSEQARSSPITVILNWKPKPF